MIIQSQENNDTELAKFNNTELRDMTIHSQENNDMEPGNVMRRSQQMPSREI